MKTNEGDAVSWEVAPTDTRFGRLCGYALVGVLGAFAFLALALVAIAVGAAVASGDGGTLFVVVVLVLVGGPFSVLGLVAFLDADQRPDDWWPTEAFDLGALHPLGVAVSVALAATGLVATFTVETVLALAAYPLVAVLFLASMGLAIGGPSGRVDRDADTLTVHGNTHPLADLSSVRALDVGGLVLVHPRFVARPGGRDAPALFTIPSDAYDRVRDDLDAGVAADSTVDATRSRSDRVATGAAGVGSLVLAVALVALGATSSVDGAEILYFVASFPTFFGVLFLALAARRRA
ncbi:hypothetical protein [Halorubellus sp. PRR65]|uniref:hypothetical protein n=1 Tax=Halorubellus sp. PRR65 TaxID=3098148 RepID=UPI002B2641C2|nr:hypothetical protein [Halorubellus sp. PRR65]